MSGGPLDVLAARARLYRRALPTAACSAYLLSNGLGLKSLGDPDPIADHVGLLTLMRVAVLPGNRWDFLDEPTEAATAAAIIEAFARDGFTTTDLVAWPVEEPNRILTMFGRADMLGLAHLYNATTYAFDKPLVVYRTPLAWLQSGCRGAVVIDPAEAARHLLDAPGRISGEDRQHSEELAELVSGLFDLSRFVAPVSTHMQEAA